MSAAKGAHRGRANDQLRTTFQLRWLADGDEFTNQIKQSRCWSVTVPSLPGSRGSNATRRIVNQVLRASNELSAKVLYGTAHR